MDYRSIEKLLLTPADEYFEKYIRNIRRKTQAINWIRSAKNDIIENTVLCDEEKMKTDRPLVLHMIQYPSKRIKLWYHVGNATVMAMNDALRYNDLSLDMNPNHIEALLQLCKCETNRFSTSFLDLMSQLCVSKDDGTVSVAIGQSLIPGYECTLNFKKI